MGGSKSERRRRMWKRSAGLMAALMLLAMVLALVQGIFQGFKGNP